MRKDSTLLQVLIVSVVSAIVASVFAVGMVKVAQKTGLLGAVDTDISANFYQVHTTDEAQFDGAVAARSSLTVSRTLSAATSTLGRTISSGQVTALTGVATSTLTAAQVCNAARLTITPVSTTPTITFPATSTLFAASGGCLTSNGQYIDLAYGAVTTSTILAAGTGGTAGFSSSLTVAADKSAFIRIIRDSATTYVMYVLNLAN